MTIMYYLKNLKVPLRATFLVCLLTTALLSCDHNKGNNEKEIVSTGPANWAERLGFPPGKKVFILHADDIGMCEEANLAAVPNLENDHIQSAAAMPPCPNFEAFIEWAKAHPEEDIGLHLTLTSEWKTHRWGPVSDPSEVPSLIDPDGKLWPEVHDVVAHATVEDIEKEVRAQIEKSLALGYRPDHIDTHMGTLFGHVDYLKVFIKIAEEYGIPANIVDLNNPEVARQVKEAGYPIDRDFIAAMNEYSMPKLDHMVPVPERAKTYEKKKSSFFSFVKSLPPGLVEFYFHPSTDSDNLKTITNSWQERVWEAQMFSDPEVKKFFQEEGVLFTNWKEIMERFKNTK